MKNKRYIRLSKQMKGVCKGNCNGGTGSQCKYYAHCFNGHILFPKKDSLRYLQERLKGKGKISIFRHKGR